MRFLLLSLALLAAAAGHAQERGGTTLSQLQELRR